MPLFNHPRAKKLIAETIDRLELSLAGLHIFTEAASNNFVVTPIIAAMAGAESVAAIARDSAYGSFKQIREETLQLAEYCGISSRLEVVSHKEQALLDRADIVTNLGFVRPLDADTIAMIKPGAVIPLMFEKWESRPGEIDLELCRRKNISVVATNEDQSLVNVFNYMGSLALKMVLDGAIELYKSRLAVIGRDKFAKAVHSLLSAMGLHIEHFSSLNGVMERAMLGSLDALIIADYVSQELIIGAGGQIEAEELARLAPTLTVIPLCGEIDVVGIKDNGIRIHPEHCQPYRMSRTLAYLGPRPVIELHAAGLKSAELALKRKIRNLTVKESRLWSELAELIV